MNDQLSVGQPQQSIRPPTTAWAIAALIFGIIGAALVSIVCAAIALAKTRTGQVGGRGLAITGLILSGTWIVVGVIAVAVFVLLPDDSPGNRYPPAVGTCYASEPDDGLDESDEVACDQPHRAEVFAVFTVPGDTYPGDDVLEKYTSRCSSEFAKYAAEDAAGFDIDDLRPTRETWSSSDRTVKCLAVTQDPVTGSAQG
ncbi:septum formation family protein [Mycolicibacterium wolinskyi]|uniref:Septum formation-related domain-containing protein n=1 Tax=Mycolicibacterium wolinskyi TaxID=59750 RepID=A0A1X2FDZ9_9MYCO|nr:MULTISPECIES: DUF4190 domain-containing protein [Mycolicibacterium]MCV7284588.1 septum formation family protein [Mycolicibacterium wolinskyi]MCV7291973.1 septum formation family protein [Mycolicibacterium goodii]ORX16665.1 hypothetical protein AWC31_21865 [Mycolicibacterium wolinskyi]